MTNEPADAAARARRSVGLAALPGAVHLRVTGPGAVSFLHRILSCDVAGLPPGGAAPGLLLTPKGKVVADLLLSPLEGRVELAAPAAARPDLAGGLGRFALLEDVVLEDLTEGRMLLALVGPRAEAAAARALGGDLPPSPSPGAADAVLEGYPAVLWRRTRAGLPAVEFAVAAEAAAEARGRLLAAAEAEGGGVLEAGDLEVLRVEHGVPALGAEFGGDTLPQEAGLDDHVSFTKGCFLGQEPVARLRNLGRTRRGLAGLVLDPASPVPAPGDAVLAGEREVGAVTSAVRSPSLGRPAALAMVHHDHAAPGARLGLRTGGAVLSCEVVPLPLVRGGGGGLPKEEER